MILAAATLLMAEAAPITPAPITIDVTNVRNSKGQIHVGLCPKDKFLGKACPYEASAPAHTGTTSVTIAAVPPGDYAAQSFHDENNNREIDRVAVIGIPKEGVGFSRDAKIRMGPPKWDEAVFTHGAQPQAIHFALRYFLGASGPDKVGK